MRPTRLLIALSFILYPWAVSVAQTPLSTYDLNRPFGWGAQPGFEVTGGAGGTEVVVTTEAEFEAAITTKDPVTKERDVPMIIYVKGEIEFKSMHTWHVKNKTILGLPGSRIYSKDRTKKNSGIMKFSSGSGADSENIILRNLTIQGAGAYDTDGDDALLFQGVKRIWVDHCTIGDGVDSSFDCNHESDYVCVTWCHFIYRIPPLAGGSGGADDHRFCNTWGASDKATESIGHLNTTFANCWWDEGCMERCPRVRFGKVHVVNCYYTNTGNHYSIGYGYQSNIYAEKCWFANGVVIDKDYTDAKHGYPDYNYQLVGCQQGGSSVADKKQDVGGANYFDPDDYYTYEGFDVNLVPSVVGNENTGAGANLMVEVGKGVTGYVNGGGTTINQHFDASRPHSADYYSLSGVQQKGLRHGLNIVRQQMSDGSVKTIKIAK
ncbi:MAG: chromophore lyase [Prevotella sp.]|nr:chromophore lyase [Prevotella sp.]MBQ9203714.1 chromophore lyase [Prevotella sp.]